MSRRLLAVLITGAIAAAGSLAWSGWPPHSDYLPILICYEVIGLSFLVAGIAAWVRWPASRLGLLFTIAGYLYLLPYILVNLANPVAFTIGNLSQGIYTAAVAHLGLAWPTGRLRSRFECGVVIAEYVTAVGFSLAAIVFWNPAFSGCDASCPANVLLVGDGSRSAGNAISTIGGFVGLVLTAIVLTLIVRHWRSARGWSRRAMVPLVWLAVRGRDRADRNRRCPQPAPFKPGQLRASPAGNAGRPGSVRDQHGAGADSGRRARHRDRGPGTGSLAGPAPGGACPGTGRLDAAARVPATGWVRLSRHREPGRRRGPARSRAGRGAGSRARTRPSWSTTRAWRSSRSWSGWTAAAASMALEHARLQAEVQAQLEQVRASRARIVEAGDAERRRLERDLHDGAQQRWSP